MSKTSVMERQGHAWPLLITRLRQGLKQAVDFYPKYVPPDHQTKSPRHDGTGAYEPEGPVGPAKSINRTVQAGTNGLFSSSRSSAE